MLCCAKERGGAPDPRHGHGALCEAREGTFPPVHQRLSLRWQPLAKLRSFYQQQKGGKSLPPLPGTHLVTGGTAGSEELGVVPAAVDPPVLLEVDEVHQQLVAEVAGEAGRVPELVPQPGCRNPRVPFVQPPAALQGRGNAGFGARLAFGDGSPLGNGCCLVLGGVCLTFLQGQPWQGPGTGHASPCPRASRLRRALNARSFLRSSSARSGQNRSCAGRQR